MASHHISLPRTTLMQFSKSGAFYYLDIFDNQIKKAYAETYNTEDNYYPTDTERFLSTEIETIIGRLRKRLDDFITRKPELSINRKMIDDAIKCLAVQQLRVPTFIEIVKSKSVYGGILNFPDEFFSPLHRGDYDRSVHLFQETLSGYEMNVCTIAENSGFSFILPVSHCLCVGKLVLIVLTPYRALALLPSEDNAKYYMPDGGLACLSINQYSELVPLYMKTVQEEKRRGGRIVGLKDQLETIQRAISETTD
jgi:hypothetical protein